MISVIIPAYNAQATLEKCLQALCASDDNDHEVIVIDDGSIDETRAIAQKFADRVLVHEFNRGRVAARRSGMREARGDIIVNIDADVEVKPDSLSRIAVAFEQEPQIMAVTGCVDQQSHGKDFFSCYKHFYLNYIFSRLPNRVSFVYGSVYAFRRQVADLYNPHVEVADDTEFGQALYRRGHEIRFLRDLEVRHLKELNFISWLKNDFRIPFDWACIFCRYQGWRELGRKRAGFAHAPAAQLLSVILAPVMVLVFFAQLTIGWPAVTLGALFVIWLLLNARFFYFLSKRQGFVFGFIQAVPITLLDHGVMAAGIVCGMTAEIVDFSKNEKEEK